ncbi:MAG: hypothetical protein UEE32_03920 [Oscillospiraceae bacterium]|nr:hypothetical protein [Oscillospiraceae bacterium]
MILYYIICFLSGKALNRFTLWANMQIQELKAPRMLPLVVYSVRYLAVILLIVLGVLLLKKLREERKWLLIVLGILLPLVQMGYSLYGVNLLYLHREEMIFTVLNALLYFGSQGALLLAAPIGFAVVALLPQKEDET